MFLAVTLPLKDRRRQSGLIRSNRILDPATGAFGKSRLAGCSANSRRATHKLGSTAVASPAAKVKSTRDKCSFKGTWSMTLPMQTILKMIGEIK